MHEVVNPNGIVAIQPLRWKQKSRMNSGDENQAKQERNNQSWSTLSNAKGIEICIYVLEAQHTLPLSTRDVNPSLRGH